MAKPPVSPLAVLKLSLILLWVLFCIPPHLIGKFFKKEVFCQCLVQRCYKGIAWLIGLRVMVMGELITQGPAILASNHVSYLDIIALGSIGPVYFTPKSDIDSWPLIGWICRQCNAVFIDRRASMSKTNEEHLRHALEKNVLLSLFPEGSTGNGRHLLPFKSGIFSVIEAMPDTLAVQPLALRYETINGLPIDTTQWPDIAWYGDMELLPHALKLLSFSRIGMTVIALPMLEKVTDRKELGANLTVKIERALNEQSDF